MDMVNSYEEAKKKMYAFSTCTITYQGFQCLVSEEESQKFEGLPGVVFILPDSYIDPVNKEFGGDKYENGIITPRPLPMQYGRQGGRYGDRNGGFSRSNGQRPNEQGNRGYVNQGSRHVDNMNFAQQKNSSLPNQQANQGYNNQGHRYGDNMNFNRGYNQGHAIGDNRNYGPPQNHPVQPNYGPVGGERRNSLPLNNSPGGRDLSPPYQGINYASPQDTGTRSRRKLQAKRGW